MLGTATVILTAENTGLIKALGDRYPQILALVIGDRIPEVQFEGRLWCFVDRVPENGSNLDMCRQLRQAANTRHGHITLAITDNSPGLREQALQAGADDYVIGSLGIEHIAERLDMGGATTVPAQQAIQLKHGELLVDLTGHRVRYKGRAIDLPLNEFRLLAHFVANPDRLFSRKSLIDSLGKQSRYVDEETVNVWVGRLRRLLSAADVPDPLRTVRSLGYVLDSIT